MWMESNRPTNHRPRVPLTLATLLGASLVLIPAVVAAQVAPVEATAQQVTLHGQGVAAAKAGKWDEAIAIFQQSLKLGPLNLTWLNLGRTLQYAGRCDEALEAYSEAIVAPKVARPSPAHVAEVIVTYRKELKTKCTGTLVLSCKPLNLKLTVDGEPSEACDGRPVVLTPGVHVLVARTATETRELLFEVEAGASSALTVEFESRGAVGLHKSFMPKISESASGGILQ